eukprot:TRINITY_DN11008_c0_g1_i2.p1 TRINITY_DN11008_c0_g1~~TRINITY_DN11008_c0_g1_i2.p1  ORF type:complete len:249 (+),score=76.12 TRINITY_DN11008_c0_g1_i2:84-830(+)
MAGVKWVIGGWLGFVTENVVLSENRTAIIEATDARTYHMAYSALSCASMGSLFYGVYKHGTKAVGRRHVGLPRAALGLALKTAGVVGLSQSLPPFRNVFSGEANVPAGAAGAEGMGGKNFCPIDLSWKKGAEGKEVYGFKRITRHPQLWSLATFGLGVAAASACPVVRLAGAGFTPTVLVLAAHQDSRYARGIGGSLSDETWATTSHVPFVAVAQGHQSLAQAWEESKQTNAMLGAAACLLWQGGSLL